MERDRWIYEAKIESLTRDLDNARETLRAAGVEIEILKGDHRDFQQEIGTLNQTVGMRDREIEVLTTERDNALLRIEELERKYTELEDFWADA
jgi:chromosome segregation ATPase